LAILPLATLEAIGYQKALTSGTTHPCVFDCEILSDETRTTVEYAVKFKSEVRSGSTGLLFEVIAAQLAKRLYIPIPEPALIELTSQLADAIPERDIAARVRNSAGLNFGTRFLSPGYSTWIVNDSVPIEIRQTAAEIVAFDVLIDNADRRKGNPNLLWKENEIFVIDHELAFAFVMSILPVPEPWLDRDLNFIRQDHPLYSGLKGQTIDLRRFEGELASIADNEIDDIFASVPQEFGTLHMEQISNHLRNSRDHADELVEAVGRILK